VIAVVASPVACAGFIGIDEPHVVDPGDADGSGDAAGGSDASPDDRADGGTEAMPQPPASCQTAGFGLTNCGPHGDESCCASPLVDGGTFYRSYDDVSFTSQGDPATISTFRLDRFEVTVGRFRLFVDRVVAGWAPDGGSGTHAYLNGGSGLNGEQGWDQAWNANFATTAAAWDTTFASYCPTTATWTGAPELPINCITWYEAYAFCIWDGGFLPSEAEWNYAAAGGAEQRVYPWSSPATSTDIACTQANYANQPTCGTTLWNGGTTSPAGDGKWGQADLAGNVREWVLDSYAAYMDPCNDCVLMMANSLLVTRGGSFADPAMFVLSSYRPDDSPGFRDPGIGVRCARSPSVP
jgi:formylglycine-generating enzyme required for sulfatase activity